MIELYLYIVYIYNSVVCVGTYFLVKLYVSDPPHSLTAGRSGTCDWATCYIGFLTHNINTLKKSNFIYFIHTYIRLWCTIYFFNK